MPLGVFAFILSLFVSLAGCDKAPEESTAAVAETSNTTAPAMTSREIREEVPGDANVPPATGEAEEAVKPKPNYVVLRQKITYGNATLYEVRQAMTNRNEKELVNTVHALYSMRWHRGAYHVIEGLWKLDREKYPEFSWDLIEKNPVRIAVASTLNRINPVNAVYKDYLHEHMHDDDSFNRAQVVVALGFNGDPRDVEYLKSMAEGDDPYVAQSAITGLALISHVKGRDALIDILSRNKGTPKGDLIASVLLRSYNYQTDQADQPEETETE